MDCLWTRTTRGAATHVVVPDGCVDILYELGDDARPGFVVGAMTEPRTVELRGLSRIAAVRFRPGGARAFLDVPLGELTDERCDLDQLWDDESRRFDRLAAESSEVAHVRLLERELLTRRRRDVTPIVTAAVARIERARGDLALAALARDLGVSRQYLARKFVAEVGTTPKGFARVRRFEHARELLQRGLDAVDVALQAGFYDQSHMIAEFRALAGTTPSRASA